MTDHPVLVVVGDVVLSHGAILQIDTGLRPLSPNPVADHFDPRGDGDAAPEVAEHVVVGHQVPVRLVSAHDDPMASVAEDPVPRDHGSVRVAQHDPLGVAGADLIPSQSRPIACHVDAVVGVVIGHITCGREGIAVAVNRGILICLIPIELVVGDDGTAAVGVQVHAASVVAGEEAVLHHQVIRIQGRDPVVVVFVEGAADHIQIRHT